MANKAPWLELVVEALKFKKYKNNETFKVHQRTVANIIITTTETFYISHVCRIEANETIRCDVVNIQLFNWRIVCHSSDKPDVESQIDKCHQFVACI